VSELKLYLDGKFGGLHNDNQELRESINRRMDVQDQRLNAVEAQSKQTSDTLLEVIKRLEVLEMGSESQFEQAKAIEQRIEKAEAATPVRSSGGFNRPPDPTRLKINAKGGGGGDVTKKDLEKLLVSGLLPGAGLVPECVEVIGDEVASRFLLQFMGIGQIPVSGAEQFIRSLKRGGGKWKEVWARGDDDAKIQIFFGEDLGPKLEKDCAPHQKTWHHLQTDSRGQEVL